MTKPMTGSPPTSSRSPGRRTATVALACALAALAGVLALVVAPAAGAASTTNMVLEGRGWGHGIGLSQYGADGYALHGWKYGAIIKHYDTGVTLGKVADVKIRVLLRGDASSAAVTGDWSGLRRCDTSACENVRITVDARATIAVNSTSRSAARAGEISESGVKVPVLP